MYRTFLSSASELQQMIDFMDRVFNTGWSEGNSTRASDVVYNLPVDIWEKDNFYFIRAAVPGVKPENLDITVQDNVLTLGGEVKHQWEGDQNVKFWRLETTYGKFRRSIRLPEQVKTDEIEAAFESGFVTITIPKLVLEPQVIRVPIKGSVSRPMIEQMSSAPEEKALDSRRSNGTGKEPVGSAS